VIEAGKDCFVEKPLSLSVTDSERLNSLADEYDRILMVGHILHYHPAVIALKELVASGQRGRIDYIYSNRLNIRKSRWCNVLSVLSMFDPAACRSVSLRAERQAAGLAAA
jgi:predicted dehydrogenase